MQPLPQTDGNPTDSNDPPLETNQPQNEPQGGSETPPLSTPEAPISEALAAFDRFHGRAPEEPSEPAGEGEGEGEGEPSGEPSDEHASSNAPSRDYSGLEEDEIPFFKKMGNVAFAFVKPRFLAEKKLREENEKLKQDFEQASKGSFYENPDAYQLTEEYRHTAGNVNLVNNEIEMWQSAIASIRAGEKPKILLGYDNSGNPVLEEREPTPQIEGQIISALSRAHQIRERLIGNIENMKTSFTTKHQTFVEKMEDIRKNVVFKGVDEKKLEAAVKTKLKLFPSYLHNRPEFRIIAGLLAVQEGQAKVISDLKAKQLTGTTKARIASNNGPPARRVSGGQPKSDTIGAAVNQFERYKATHGF